MENMPNVKYIKLKKGVFYLHEFTGSQVWQNRKAQVR